MIPDTARYHGSFFILLFERIACPVDIRRLPEFGSGFYLLNNRAPILIKHSTKRRGPWGFNFHKNHQENLGNLVGQYGDCIICLACGRDGIVGLQMDELRHVLNGEIEDQESVSIRRRLKTMYSVKGRDGVLERRIGRNAVFEKIQDMIR